MTPPSPMPDELRRTLEPMPASEREALERTWDALGRTPPPTPPLDVEATWKAVRARIELQPAPAGQARPDRPPRARPSRPRPTRWRGPVAAGAVFLALVAIGLLVGRQPIRVAAAPGTTQVAELPDGSTVELNSGSTLAYPRRFAAWPGLSDDRRVVRLEGEAFFEVVRSDRPFVVETFNARVEVLGTRFNVRARPDEPAPATRVTLGSGRVRVHSAEAEGSVVLAATGQTTRVARTIEAPTPVDPAHAFAWREGGLFLSEQPLTALFKELERRYAVPIKWDTPATREPTLTLFYPQPVSLETVLDDVCTANGLRYHHTPRGYAIVTR